MKVLDLEFRLSNTDSWYLIYGPIKHSQSVFDLYNLLVDGEIDKYAYLRNIEKQIINILDENDIVLEQFRIIKNHLECEKKNNWRKKEKEKKMSFKRMFLVFSVKLIMFFMFLKKK